MERNKQQKNPYKYSELIFQKMQYNLSMIIIFTGSPEMARHPHPKKQTSPSHMLHSFHKNQLTIVHETE